ncbi:hypothetical protein R3I93_006651 [Phoxinus phoxinus]|uniref:Uncharacterized protein n=1 Tax=Phoxinus phoxinus TaxID=58324 RepID=A0AAN9H7G2_9TELE
MERTAAEKEGEICNTTPEAVSFQDIKQEVPDGAIGKQKSSPPSSSSLLGDHEETLDGKDVVHGDISNNLQKPSKTSISPQHQLTSWWKRKDTEVVVSVVPT